MKNLLLSLVVLASLVSCGKDNKVSSGANATQLTNPIMVGNTTAQVLITQLDNPTAGFGNGLVADYTSNQTCKNWGIFNYCYSSTTGTAATGARTWNTIVAANPNTVYYYTNGTTTVHSQIAVVTKQNEIRAILNSASSIQVQALQGGNVYYVTVAGGYYVIDTRYPLQVNPSAVSTGTTQNYFMRAY